MTPSPAPPSSETKPYRQGTHRTRPPAETVADFGRYRPHFGITRIANITGLDTIGIPVFQAVRPNSRGLTTAQGKGLDPDGARASALMESIEGWHAENIVAPARYDSFAGLARSVDAIDPRMFPSKPGVEVRLDTPLLWLEGHELLRDGPVWVPYDTVTTNLVLNPSMTHVFPITSNGLASGNTRLEAACHALYELIERDAIALSAVEQAAGTPPARIDIATVPYPDVHTAAAMFRAAEAPFCVLDITSDVGIPCFACVLGDPRDTAPWSRKGLCGGHGCHLDPGIAMLRAMTEAAQSRVTLIAGSRDDTFGATYESLAETALADALGERLFTSPAVPFDRPERAGDTFEADLDAIVTALRRIGAPHVVLVDLSQPHPHVPVVRAVVTELEPSSDGNFYRPGPRAQAMQRARGSA